MKHLLLMILLLPGMGSAEEAVSFSGDVMGIFMKECAYCHMREENYGYLVIDRENAYANLVGVAAYSYPTLQRVQPGQPQKSYLWLKLTGQHYALGGKGWAMPYGPLPAADLQLIRRWIEQGARDN